MELFAMRRRMTMILEGMMVLTTLVAVVDNYSPDIVELLNTESNRWKGWIKNSGRYDGWRSQNIPPNGQLVYGLCSMQSDSRDNWLRSPFIQKEEAVSISVEITFTMRSCKARPEQRNHCEDSLYLMAYEADNPSDIPSSWNDRIYTTVAVVSPDIKWTDMTEENIMNIKTYSIEPGRAGFFIALRDNGACAMVKLVRVYYVACATITRSFADYPRTVVSNDYRIRDVKGVCVPGAELIDIKKVPYMLCQPSGEWHLLNTIFCRCQAGYTPSENNMYCIKCPYNTYKLKSGSEKCKFCPKYSSSGIGASNCTCDQGFVPVLLSPEKLSCIEHLKNPQNLKANLTEFGQVHLEWDKFPSLDDLKRSDGSNKYYYKVFCVSCKEWEKLHFIPGAVVTHTSVLIDALESDKMYNFSVMVANSLNQDIMGLFPNTSYSFASITTKSAKKSYQIRDFVVSKIESEHSILVSWSPTPGIEVDNYQIVIHGLSISPGNPKPIILDPILENIKVTQHKFPYLKKPVFAYRIKVRIRSKGFWGPFSNEKEINLNNGSKINIIQNDFEESKKDLWNPTKVLIVSIFSCGLALVATAIPLCFYFRYIISRSIRKGKKKIVKKPLSTTFDVANYSQIYTGSSNTKVYIDPSNYEDPSTIVQEFALEIDPDNVKIECVIGEGEFGEVCKGRLIKHESRRRITVAVKTLKSNFSEKERMNFLMEAGIMGQFNHPNIIRLEGVVTKTQPVMIITQFMEHGSLDAFLKKNVNKFSTLQLLGMLKGIVSGMRYLSEMHYVHRDLAARNILIDQNLCCKVSDFGLSREIEADNTEGAYTTKGGLIPIRWTAPEAINYRRFTSSSDVWSFGIVMWEVMSYGERPYWNWANKDVLQSIEAGYRLPAPKNCPPSIHLLMLDCWTYERSQRPKFSKILHSIDALLRYPESLYSLPLSFSVSKLSISGSYKSSYPLIPKPKHKDQRSKSLLTQELVFSPESTVSQWLECLELPCYKDNFSNHNLIYLFQISKFTRNHLISLHISEEEHLQKLMCNIEAMQNYFETTQTTSFSLL